jgi:LuxR family transcriptional regulator, quorum-sensing system regulator CviR
MHKLSKRDILNTLDLIQASLSCKSLDQFQQLIFNLQKIIAFDVATCLTSKRDVSGKIQSLDIVNVNYPSEWIEIYVANNYQQSDPILKTNFQDFKLQYWADTYRKSPPSKEFLFVAEDFGLKQGYTHGARNYTGDEGSLFSVSGPSLERCERTETILTTAIPHLHQAFCRAANYTQVRNCTVLTPREKEILNWMKQGKTSWEISVILHISERTVNFHAQNIMQKLNASSRAHAVAIALEERVFGTV